MREPKYLGDHISDEQWKSIKGGVYDWQQDDYWVINGIRWYFWWDTRWDDYFPWGKKNRKPSYQTIILPQGNNPDWCKIVLLPTERGGYEPSSFYEYTHDGAYIDKQWMYMARNQLELNKE